MTSRIPPAEDALLCAAAERALRGPADADATSGHRARDPVAEWLRGVRGLAADRRRLAQNGGLDALRADGRSLTRRGARAGWWVLVSVELVLALAGSVVLVPSRRVPDPELAELLSWAPTLLAGGAVLALVSAALAPRSPRTRAAGALLSALTGAAVLYAAVHLLLLPAPDRAALPEGALVRWGLAAGVLGLGILVLVLRWGRTRRSAALRAADERRRAVREALLWARALERGRRRLRRTGRLGSPAQRGAWEAELERLEGEVGEGWLDLARELGPEGWLLRSAWEAGVGGPRGPVGPVGRTAR
ncbi:hypothetical protein [Brachybacterium sp. J153]|uniref:hypothetical protein n=1 Tax=Brachybacterium sp. J153 TaxID=3116488 RepID=UPI002E7A14BE|nr:hypothetical protein [Brachybacterium sp. J153]MEE1617782.1 hypothetical protein [Brachybacterium sp. J153]